MHKTDQKDKELLALLSHSAMTTGDLAGKLFMSASTVRRRLAELEREGLVLRTHGGAVLRQDARSGEIPLSLRTLQSDEEKKAVAQKAVNFIRDGDVIFLDSSSTTLFLIPFLDRFQNISVCTNSLKAATLLAEQGVVCTLLGGDVVPGALCCNSPETARMVENIYADVFFFSCDGLSAKGILTDKSKANNHLRLLYMKNAKKSVLLLDSSKAGKQYPHRLCSLCEVDVCICNEDLGEAVTETAPNIIYG